MVVTWWIVAFLRIGGEDILSSQVVSLPLQLVMEVANFCAAMDTLIGQDVVRMEW